MKAYIYVVKYDKDILCSEFITKNYSNLRTLIKYSFKNKPAGMYHIVGFYNWNDRNTAYREPDINHYVFRQIKER